MSSGALLDNPEHIKKLDTENMLGIVRDSPKFIAWCLDTFDGDANNDIATKLSDFLADTLIKGVFIVGMGGSAISGDVLHDWVVDVSKTPVVVIRGYELPAYIDDSWLGIFVSYSGNTEETLSCLLHATSRGIKCIGITSGGLLRDILARFNAPCFEVPKGYQPRAAFLYLFTALALVFLNLNIIKKSIYINELKEAKELLLDLSSRYSADVPVRENFAKQQALNLHDSIILIYGFGHYISVARRLKGQFNENGKNPAYYDFFTELNNNNTLLFEKKYYIKKK
ncbi:MAG: SIS domain-containing protein [Promethearchaeota archaeon]